MVFRLYVEIIRSQVVCPPVRGDNPLALYADPEGGGRGSGHPPPLKNHKKGFLSNIGPDPLKNHKANKPAFNFGPSSARQRNAIFNGGPIMVRFWCYLDPLSSHKKPLSKLDPSGKTFWIRACACVQADKPWYSYF